MRASLCICHRRDSMGMAALCTAGAWLQTSRPWACKKTFRADSRQTVSRPYSLRQARALSDRALGLLGCPGCRPHRSLCSLASSWQKRWSRSLRKPSAMSVG